MGKIEIKQIPSELHPSGDRLLKIAWDDKEPPKDYVWAKGKDDYYIWDGKKWIPYEFELINDKRCIQKNCGCITKEELVVKFDKFKKDVLAAVSRIAKTQEAIDVSEIRRELAELRVIMHQLEEFENYYTKSEIDSNYYDKDAVDQKIITLNDLINIVDGSVSSLSRRVNGIGSDLSDVLFTLSSLGNLNGIVIASDISSGDDTSLDES